MASILERIEQMGAGGAQPQQAGVEKLLRQKRGKATQRKGPATSSLGEQAVIGAGKQAMADQSFASRLAEFKLQGAQQAQQEQAQLQQQALQQKGQLAQEQMTAQAIATREKLQADQEAARIKRQSGEERSVKQLNHAAEQKLRDLASQRNITLDNIFSQYEFDTAELEDRKDAAELEQNAFLLSMHDRKYMEEISEIGKMRQFDNDVEADKETQRIVFGESLHNLLDTIKFKTERNVDRREYAKQIAHINIEQAIQIAQAAIKDENTRQQWESVGNMTTSAVTYADKKYNKKENNNYYINPEYDQNQMESQSISDFQGRA